MKQWIEIWCTQNRMRRITIWKWYNSKVISHSKLTFSEVMMNVNDVYKIKNEYPVIHIWVQRHIMTYTHVYRIVVFHPGCWELWSHSNLHLVLFIQYILNSVWVADMCIIREVVGYLWLVSTNVVRILDQVTESTYTVHTPMYKFRNTVFHPGCWELWSHSNLHLVLHVHPVYT